MPSIALSQFAYSKIREMIQDSRITAGMKISETKLAEQLGISRTPVREAIRQLQQEGLLYQVPQSGTYVSKPGRREISEIYEVRLALELQAVGKAASRLNHEHLEELGLLYWEMHEEFARFQDGNLPILEGEGLRRFLAADLEFHLTIFRAADNLTAIKIYSDIQMKHRAFGYQSHRRDIRHLTQVLNSHRLILGALQISDGEAAKEAMEAHITDSLRDALRTFDQIPAIAEKPPTPKAPR